VGRTLFQAHRGASGLAPENTPAAYELCLQWKPDYIELDVQLSRDGHLVVIHDPTLKRTTNGTGNVKDYTLAELKALDAGSWFDAKYTGERIPTLLEVIQQVRGRVKLAIEIKYGSIMYPGIEEKLVDLIVQEGMLEDVVFSSFNWDSIRQVKQLEPRAKTQIIAYGHSSEFVPLAASFGCSFIAVEWHYVTPQMLAAAAKAGLQLNAWVIDDPAEIARWIGLGVPVITTNRPDRFRAVLDGEVTHV
jgi:glycerophosphoryl diester phosphodiesterase